MLDWQVSEEEQPLASLPQEERPVRRVRRWYLWGGLFLVLVVAGLLLFRWRLSERTEAMEADLKAFIRHEEQQRAFGLAKQADQLMVSNAPTDWQQAYRLSFADPDSVREVSLEIEEIELNGSEAYVTVRLDNARRKRRVAQVRFYRLVGQEWRRAPLFAAFWGEEKQIELADEDITIVYPTREEAFAQKLAADLPALLQQSPNNLQFVTPFTIKIEPMEFAPAQLYISHNDDTTQIALNSPQLIVPEYAEVDGEGAIRFTLANTLLEEVNLDYDAQRPILPGGVTFLGALRNTFILRWALPNEAIPRQIWRDKMAELSSAPFLGQWKINRGKMKLARVWEPHLSEAMSLRIADYLYDQHGHEMLNAISEQLPSAQSWDRIFYPLTGHYTIEVEQAALWQDSADQTVTSVPNLPLPVLVLDVDARTGVLEVQVAGQEKRLSIETDNSALLDAERMNLGSECAILHQELIIEEGDWLEMGQALQARQLMVNGSQPAILPEEMVLAPPDTLAYLAEQGERGFGAFLALSEDGSTTDLSTLPQEITAGWHMQSSIPWPARFLLTVTVPNCEQTWLLMYDPQQGVVDYWLTPSSNSITGVPFMWRPQEGDIVFMSLFANNQRSYEEMSYVSAKPGHPLRLLGQRGSWPHPLGWLGDEMVALEQEREAVQLINPESGDVTKSIPLTIKNARYFMLSKDGKTLFYTNEATQRPTLMSVSLESGEEQVIYSSPDNELLWPISARNGHLLLRVGPEMSGRLFPTDFLLLDVKTSEQAQIVMEISSDEGINGALLCAENRVLMSMNDNQRRTSEVRMWEPDSGTKSLLKSDRELMLVSCR